jgi:hypothetical protein
MMDFIRQGGFMMYPIIAGTMFAVVSAVRAAAALQRGEAAKSAADGVIFWGGLAMLLGVLGTLVGFSMMARAVESVGDVAPSLLWGGIRVALTTAIAGCGVFVLSLFTWAPLRWLGSRKLPPSGRRLALLEQELQALRGDIHQMDERMAFYEKLGRSR